MYIKKQWRNGETPLNATNMNHIEEGIAALDQEALKPSSVLKGPVPPTTSTVASYVGQNYVCSSSNILYVCVAIKEGQYIWVPLNTKIIIENDSDIQS